MYQSNRIHIESPKSPLPIRPKGKGNITRSSVQPGIRSRISLVKHSFNPTEPDWGCVCPIPLVAQTDRALTLGAKQ